MKQFPSLATVAAAIPLLHDIVHAALPDGR
jgi:hypothetical protein